VAQDGRGRGVQHDLGKDARGQESQAWHARGGMLRTTGEFCPLDKTEILDKSVGMIKNTPEAVLKMFLCKPHVSPRGVSRGVSPLGLRPERSEGDVVPSEARDASQRSAGQKMGARRDKVGDLFEQLQIPLDKVLRFGIKNR
jgi:hypothetical protein